jgi:dipeptidyl aminopeptidase/acylaminoacyl peptidase
MYRVPASGGAPSPVRVADTTVYLRHPHLLPGGRAALVTTTPDFTAGRLGVLDLATGALRQFGPGAGARYVGGNLVYVGLTGELYRQPFDLARREPTGSAEQIGGGLDEFSVTHSVNAASLDAAPTGALVYRVGAAAPGEGTLRLVVTDRAGRELRAVAARVPWAPRFSPDGRRVAYGAYAPGRDSSDLWIADVSTGVTQRLTTDGNDNNDPHWSPDGTSLAYSANVSGDKDVFVRRLDGGPARRLARAGTQWPSDWSRDGRTLLFTDVAPGRQDIWARPAAGGAAHPYAATPVPELGARLSPDGRWVAYTSRETGRDEVYVQAFPTPAGKVLVSAGGGVNPVWGGGQGELYYWQLDQLVVARLDASGPPGAPTIRGRAVLFRAPYFENVHAMYDVSRDGSRFALVTGGARAGRLVVALHTLPGVQ